MLNALLWNVPLTAGLAVVLTALCRLPMLHRRPALRQLLWLLLIAKVITPPLIGVPLLPAAEFNLNLAEAAVSPIDLTGRPESTTYRSTKGNSTANNGADRDSNVAAQPDLPRGVHEPYFGGLVVVSLLGTLVLSTVYGIRAARLCRWLRRAGVQDPELAGACADAASSLHIREVVQGCVVDVRWTPLLWAWGRPLVVMPRQLIEELNSQELRAIIAHELAHYARRDHWTNVFVFAVKVLLWWNPVVWWADREQRAAQELCCDAIAINRCKSSRRSYAATLLKALDFTQSEPLSLYVIAPGMGSRRSVLRRFEMITETQLSYRLPRWTPWLLLISTVLLVCYPVRGQSEHAAAPAKTPAPDSELERTADASASKSGVYNIAHKIVEWYSQQMPERVYGERPRGNCSISGKLVSEATGKPIAKGTMYLFYTETSGSIFVPTDSDGTFVFRDIPQGPFSLRSSHVAGYQDVAYDPEGKSGQLPQFELGDGEQRSGITLKAKEACRVTGRIRDEKGNVPSDITSMSIRAWYKPDDKNTYSLTQSFVGRDGSYTIDCLSDKPVYVMVKNRQNERQGEGYPPIYAPSTFSRNDARLVTFDESRNVEGVDITLRKTGGLVLEGTVRDEHGEPISEAFVVAHHRDMLFDRVTAYSDAQGRYEIQGLGEGEVLVHVDAIHRGFVRTRAPITLEKTTPTVRRDFTLRRGALISGKLVDRDGKEWQIGRSHGMAYVAEDLKKPEPSWSGLPNTNRVQCIDRNSAVFYIAGEGDYCRNEMVFPTESTFIFQSVEPGQTFIEFSPQAEGQKVIKILHDGRDIMKSGIETIAGQKIENVRIVIGKR